MSRLESLPNELLLLIFRYLQHLDLLNAFASLNQRFQQLIQPSFSHFDLTGGNLSSYRRFRLFYDHVLPSHTHQIRSLTLTGSHQLELFCPRLRHCLHLTRLTIENGTHGQQQAFLTEALSLPSLSELSLASAQEDILETISICALPSLRKLTIILANSTSVLTAIRPMPHIRQLSVNLNSSTSLVTLCKAMSNLQALNLFIRGFNDIYDDLRGNVPGTLTSLSVEFGSYSEFMRRPPTFVQLQAFLVHFLPQLRSLTLIGINLNDATFSDNDHCRNFFDQFPRLHHLAYHFMTDQLSTTICTWPKPQPFDTVSSRVSFYATLHARLTPKQLLNCRTLHVEDHSSTPTHIELSNELVLRNLRTIEFSDPIDCYATEMLSYIAQIVTRAPHLNTIRLWSWHGIKAVIEPCRVAFPLSTGERITHAKVSIGVEGRENTDSYEDFLTEVAALFPNTKDLILHVEQQQLNASGQSFAHFIDHIRTKFRRIVSLEVSMWLRDEALFGRYKRDLTHLREERSIHYSIIDRNGENNFFTFNIWL